MCITLCNKTFGVSLQKAEEGLKIIVMHVSRNCNCYGIFSPIWYSYTAWYPNALLGSGELNRNTKSAIKSTFINNIIIYH